MIISRANWSCVCFCSSLSHARLSKKKSFFLQLFCQWYYMYVCGFLFKVFVLFIVMKFHLVAGAINVSFFQKFNVMVLIKY